MFSARANLANEPSSPTPRDAAVSAPRKPRRFISSSSLQSRSWQESAFAISVRVAKEVFHRCRNFYDVSLYRKMSGIEELHLRVRQVFSKCLCSRRNKKGIVLAPNRKQTRLQLTKIFVELRIEPQVRRVIQKEIELNVFVPRPFEQSRIQRVRFWRNNLRICDAVGVLPARSTSRQNALAEYLSVFFRRCRPVLSYWCPRFTKAFFVGVSVLRNDGCNALRVCHRQAEADRRAIVEHIDRVTVDLDCPCEGFDRERQSIEGIRILPFRRNFRESETRKVGCDHAVVIRQPSDEFAEHE